MDRAAADPDVVSSPEHAASERDRAPSGSADGQRVGGVRASSASAGAPKRNQRPRVLDLVLGVTSTVGVRAAAALGVRRDERAEVCRFVSRPDLTPPKVRIEIADGATEAGSIFLDPCRGFLDPRGTTAQNGHMIVDDAGELVWFEPYGDVTGRLCADLKVQRFQGEPVLTTWEGRLDYGGLAGYGRGAYVLRDTSYRTIATVSAGNNLQADLHDMVITSRDTALITIYRSVKRDKRLIESVLQEVDIVTGDVLFQWHSLDHIPESESTKSPEEIPGMGFDYLHINSVDECVDGNYLISARHTDAVYKIDRDSGAVLWRLGGEHSDFAIEDEARFYRQHDARWLPDGTLGLFDNASEKPGPASRGVVLDVDEEAKTVKLVRAFEHPNGATSVSQGGFQRLSGGNTFVGWGSQPHFTEFDPAGRAVLHGSFGPGIGSYRGYRMRWVAEPREAPAAVLRTQAGPTVYVSWNGATEVRSWRVLAGPSRDELEPVAVVAKAGFETVIPLLSAQSQEAEQAKRTGKAIQDGEYSVVVEALDEAGSVLATTSVSEDH